MRDSKKTEHPSFCMFSFSRVTSNKGAPFFGSDILHKDFIKMTVSRADVDYHLGSNWYNENGIELEAYMTYSQFSEAIAGMNTQGVPVTLRRTRDGNMQFHDYPELPKSRNE